MEDLLWWVEYAWPMGSDTIRRHGLVGVGVVLLEGAWPCRRRIVLVGIHVGLLEEVCHCVGGL